MNQLANNNKYVLYGPYHLNLYKNDIGYRNTINYYVNWLTTHHLKTKTLVDIDGGEGLMLKILIEKGYENTNCIDQNLLAVALGRNHDINVRFRKPTEISRLYDAALFCHSLSHFDDINSIAEKLTECIKDSIYIINPILENPKYNLESILRAFGLKWTVSSYHISSSTEFIKLIKKPGINWNFENECLVKYEYKHFGQKALIFSPGPSLKNYLPIEEEESYVKIGVKQAVSFRSDYDYYFFGDKNDRSIGYETDVKIIKGQKFCLCQIDHHDCPSLYSTYDAIRKFKAEPINLSGFRSSKEYKTDIARGVYKQGTTTHAAINFALFCGMRDIYLVGCDGSLSKSYTDDDNRPCGHHRNIWEQFDKYFDIEYTFINPVNIFTKKYRCL